jgi:hypothetical protein
LPSTQDLKNLDIKKVIADVSEQQTERPKVNQKKVFREEKHHTDKALITLEPSLDLILTLSTAVGSTHDYKMYKTEFNKKILTKITQHHPEAEHSFDSGFQGVKDLIPTARIPIKKPPTKRKITNNPQPEKTKLTKEQKAHNKELSQERIPIENKNRDIKIFRICKETRRHKQKGHNKFWTIVCGITNFKSYTRILTKAYLFFFNCVSVMGAF